MYIYIYIIFSEEYGYLFLNYLVKYMLCFVCFGVLQLLIIVHVWCGHLFKQSKRSPYRDKMAQVILNQYIKSTNQSSVMHVVLWGVNCDVWRGVMCEGMLEDFPAIRLTYLIYFAIHQPKYELNM